MDLHPLFCKMSALVCRDACAVALSLFSSGLAFAAPRQQQEQTPQQSQTQGQQQGQEQAPPPAAQPQPPQDPQAPPSPPAQQADKSPAPQSQQIPAPQEPSPNSQDANRPPLSRDVVPPNSPHGPADQFAPAPPLLTIPAGTVVIIRTNEALSSDQNQIGDQFTGVLDQPIVVNGFVVARRGQTVVGQVKSVKKAGRVTGVSQLGVELTDLTLVDGIQAPILTELWKASGGTSHGADAGMIVGGSALGAAIGAAADWGRGAAIGAGAGAVAGIATVLLTRGRPTVLTPESQLSFRLVDPVKVNTTQSQQAFLPVNQDDLGGPPRLRYDGGYAPYPAAPCGYYAPCYAPGYYAPGAVFYSGSGYGHRYYGYGRAYYYGPRGYFRRY
jgi:hypothetical protein